MTHTPNTAVDRDYLPDGLLTSAASIPPDTGAAAFSFTGTLAQHLPRRVAEIKTAINARRADHGEVSKLERRLVLLTARAAALARN